MEEARLRKIVTFDLFPIQQAGSHGTETAIPWSHELIVKGAFDGGAPLPVRDIITPSVHRLLVAGASVDENAVHELTKVIFDNRLDLLIRMSLFFCDNQSANNRSGASLCNPSLARPGFMIGINQAFCRKIQNPWHL